MIKINENMEMSKLKTTEQKNRKTYVTPSLKSLGELSIVTLGGSVGIGDSGMPTGPQKPPL